MLPLHSTQTIHIDHSTGTNTLHSGTPETPFSSMVLQTLSEILDILHLLLPF